MSQSIQLLPSIDDHRQTLSDATIDYWFRNGAQVDIHRNSAFLATLKKLLEPRGDIRWSEERITPNGLDLDRKMPSNDLSFDGHNEINASGAIIENVSFMLTELINSSVMPQDALSVIKRPTTTIKRVGQQYPPSVQLVVLSYNFINIDTVDSYKGRPEPLKLIPLTAMLAPFIRAAVFQTLSVCHILQIPETLITAATQCANIEPDQIGWYMVHRPTIDHNEQKQQQMVAKHKEMMMEFYCFYPWKSNYIRGNMDVPMNWLANVVNIDNIIQYHWGLNDRGHDEYLCESDILSDASIQKLVDDIVRYMRTLHQVMQKYNNTVIPPLPRSIINPLLAIPSNWRENEITFLHFKRYMIILKEVMIKEILPILEIVMGKHMVLWWSNYSEAIQIEISKQDIKNQTAAKPTKNEAPETLPDGLTDSDPADIPCCTPRSVDSCSTDASPSWNEEWDDDGFCDNPHIVNQPLRDMFMDKWGGMPGVGQLDYDRINILPIKQGQLITDDPIEFKLFHPWQLTAACFTVVNHVAILMEPGKEECVCQECGTPYRPISENGRWKDLFGPISIIHRWLTTTVATLGLDRRLSHSDCLVCRAIPLIVRCCLDAVAAGKAIEDSGCHQSNWTYSYIKTMMNAAGFCYDLDDIKIGDMFLQALWLFKDVQLIIDAQSLPWSLSMTKNVQVYPEQFDDIVMVNFESQPTVAMYGPFCMDSTVLALNAIARGVLNDTVPVTLLNYSGSDELTPFQIVCKPVATIRMSKRLFDYVRFAYGPGTGCIKESINRWHPFCIPSSTGYFESSAETREMMRGYTLKDQSCSRDSSIYPRMIKTGISHPVLQWPEVLVRFFYGNNDNLSSILQWIKRRIDGRRGKFFGGQTIAYSHMMSKDVFALYVKHMPTWFHSIYSTDSESPLNLLLEPYWNGQCSGTIQKPSIYTALWTWIHGNARFLLIECEVVDFLLQWLESVKFPQDNSTPEMVLQLCSRMKRICNLVSQKTKYNRMLHVMGRDYYRVANPCASTAPSHFSIPQLMGACQIDGYEREIMPLQHWFYEFVIYVGSKCMPQQLNQRIIESIVVYERDAKSRHGFFPPSVPLPNGSKTPIEDMLIGASKWNDYMNEFYQTGGDVPEAEQSDIFHTLARLLMGIEVLSILPGKVPPKHKKYNLKCHQPHITQAMSTTEFDLIDGRCCMSSKPRDTFQQYATNESVIYRGCYKPCVLMELGWVKGWLPLLINSLNFSSSQEPPLALFSSVTWNEGDQNQLIAGLYYDGKMKSRFITWQEQFPLWLPRFQPTYFRSDVPLTEWCKYVSVRTQSFNPFMGSHPQLLLSMIRYPMDNIVVMGSIPFDHYEPQVDLKAGIGENFQIQYTSYSYFLQSPEHLEDALRKRKEMIEKILEQKSKTRHPQVNNNNNSSNISEPMAINDDLYNNINERGSFFGDSFYGDFMSSLSSLKTSN